MVGIYLEWTSKHRTTYFLYIVSLASFSQEKTSWICNSILNKAYVKQIVLLVKSHKWCCAFNLSLIHISEPTRPY